MSRRSEAIVLFLTTMVGFGILLGGAVVAASANDLVWTSIYSGFCGATLWIAILALRVLSTEPE